ncbi:MAG: hypothetical protein AAB920_00110 [Patescibacteria group bacterium]
MATLYKNTGVRRYASKQRKEEGMPSHDGGLKVFVRKGKVEIEEWLLLIDERANLLRPYLDSITLPELMRLKCLRIDTFEHDFSPDNPKIEGDEEFSLRMQGIFRVQRWQNVEQIPGIGFVTAYCGKFQDGVSRAWGLTRKGKWVLITIHFSGQAGWKDRGYEKAELVKIEEASIVTILEATKVKPKEMWFELGKAAKEIVENRKHLLDQVLHLTTIVESEELAFSLMERGQ